MRLERWDRESSGICRFSGNKLQIRVREGQYFWLPLIVTDHHEHMYLQDWREGKTTVGEVTIRQYRDRAEIYVPFKRQVEQKSLEGICGIDVNERSINLCILKPGQPPRHIPIDVSELQAVRHASQLKRKNMQQKLDTTPQHPLQKRRLQAKYYRRERNRTNQIIHEASKRITAILSAEKVEPVFEDLTNIRDSMHSKRKSKNGESLRMDMRRRLNQWPFHKLQQAVQYKTAQHGYETHYLPNTGDQETGVRGTSSTCPKCGLHHRPNGHAFRCPACGYEANRHEVGSYNIAVRWYTKNVGKDVRPEWRQMQPRAEEAVLPLKLGVEAQRIPQLQKATEF